MATHLNHSPVTLVARLRQSGSRALTLAMMALAFVLVQPVCGAFVGPAGAAVGTAHTDGPGDHQTPCCEATDGGTLAKKAEAAPFAWGVEKNDALVGTVTPRHRGRLSDGESPRWCASGPIPQQAFYVRTSRILR